MSAITFTDKESLAENLNIAEVNKVTASNINEIKESVNALYDGSGGAPTVLKQRITLTEAEIDVLFSSPYLVIDAPGEGYQTIIHLIRREFIYGTVPYDNGGSESLFLRANSTNSTNLFNLNATNNSYTTSLAPSPNINIENQAFYLTSEADFIAGDGVINLIIYYTIEDVF